MLNSKSPNCLADSKERAVQLIGEEKNQQEAQDNYKQSSFDGSVQESKSENQEEAYDSHQVDEGIKLSVASDVPELEKMPIQSQALANPQLGPPSTDDALLQISQLQTES